MSESLPVPPHLPDDSDVDLHEPAQRAELRRPAPVLAAIAVGGALGSAARYGLGVAFPVGRGDFPWTTFAINASGCLLIGILMVLVIDVFPARRLMRPFLGVGVLGGYTTFSTYVVQTTQLLGDGRLAVAAGYLAGTVLAAVPATWLGLTLTRAAVRGLRPVTPGARA